MSILHTRSYSYWFRAVSILLVLSLLMPSTTGYLYAQSVNVPAGILSLSAPVDPVMLRGLKFDHQEPLQISFIIDEGAEWLDDEEFTAQAQRLIKYFLTALTIPAQDLWVNLSPYETDRIVPESLGQTDIGRDLLQEDYVLKQLSASLTYPDTEIGKVYWDDINKTGITNSLQKVWVVPGKTVLYESGDQVAITQASLKVYTQEDYLAAQKAGRVSDIEPGPVSAAAAFKRNILPLIEQEVNSGKNFAYLRQINNAIALAGWFKLRLKESLYGKLYIDQKKVCGIENEDPQVVQKVFEQYVAVFKAGAYDIVKREYVGADLRVGPQSINGRTHRSAPTKIIRRRYFSGGADLAGNQSLLARGGSLDVRTVSPEILDREQAAAQKGPTTIVKAVNRPANGEPSSRTASLAQKLSKVAALVSLATACAVMEAPTPKTASDAQPVKEQRVEIKPIEPLKVDVPQLDRVDSKLADHLFQAQYEKDTHGKAKEEKYAYLVEAGKQYGIEVLPLDSASGQSAGVVVVRVDDPYPDKELQSGLSEAADQLSQAAQDPAAKQAVRDRVRILVRNWLKRNAAVRQRQEARDFILSRLQNWRTQNWANNAPGMISEEQFRQAGLDPHVILPKLVQLCYVTADLRVNPDFSGLSDDFRKLFSRYKEVLSDIPGSWLQQRGYIYMGNALSEEQYQKIEQILLSAADALRAKPEDIPVRDVVIIDPQNMVSALEPDQRLTALLIDILVPFGSQLKVKPSSRVALDGRAVNDFGGIFEKKLLPEEWYLSEEPELKVIVRALAGELAAGFPRTFSFALDTAAMQKERDVFIDKEIAALRSRTVKSITDAEVISRWQERRSQPVDGFSWIRRYAMQEQVQHLFPLKPLADEAAQEEFIAKRLEFVKDNAAQEGKWYIVMMPQEEPPSTPLLGGMVVPLVPLGRRSKKDRGKAGDGQKGGAGQAPTGGFSAQNAALQIEGDSAAIRQSLADLPADPDKFTGFIFTISAISRRVRDAGLQ